MFVLKIFLTSFTISSLNLSLEFHCKIDLIRSINLNLFDFMIELFDDGMVLSLQSLSSLKPEFPG